MLDYNHDPQHCPACGSTHMSYGPPRVTYQAQSIELDLTCNKCRVQWIEIFTFSHADLAPEQQDFYITKEELNRLKSKKLIP